MLKSKYQAFSDTTTSENVFKPKKQANPITLVVLGYLLLIAVGAVLLRLPVSTHEPIDFLQALFTATSAVCVTGLSVIDISSTFTNFGDWVLIILMQLGGLGIMTVSTVLILLAGMHPGFNHQSVLLSDFTPSRSSSKPSAAYSTSRSSATWNSTTASSARCSRR